MKHVNVVNFSVNCDIRDATKQHHSGLINLSRFEELWDAQKLMRGCGGIEGSRLAIHMDKVDSGKMGVKS